MGVWDHRGNLCTQAPEEQWVCTSASLLCRSQEGHSCGCNHLEENIHVMAAKNSTRRAAPCPGCSTARLCRRSQLTAGSWRHHGVYYRAETR